MWLKRSGKLASLLEGKPSSCEARAIFDLVETRLVCHGPLAESALSQRGHVVVDCPDRLPLVRGQSGDVRPGRAIDEGQPAFYGKRGSLQMEVSLIHDQSHREDS